MMYFVKNSLNLSNTPIMWQQDQKKLKLSSQLLSILVMKQNQWNDFFGCWEQKSQNLAQS